VISFTINSPLLTPKPSISAISNSFKPYNSSIVQIPSFSNVTVVMFSTPKLIKYNYICLRTIDEKRICGGNLNKK
jgi:hypothetical protein